MNIVAIADIHGRADNLSRMGEALDWADLIVLTGDVTNFGRRAEAEKILAPLLERSLPIVAVPGNCDYPEVGQYLTEIGANIDGTHHSYAGQVFIGLGGSLPGPGSTPYEISEQEIDQSLASAINGVNELDKSILVSHQPPLDSAGDRLPSGEHVGSRAVREFIETYRPLICFTGHIHESRASGALGDTQVVNPGPLGEGYYSAVEVESGIRMLELRTIP